MHSKKGKNASTSNEVARWKIDGDSAHPYRKQVAVEHTYIKIMVGAEEVNRRIAHADCIMEVEKPGILWFMAYGWMLLRRKNLKTYEYSLIMCSCWFGSSP
jgi:hypothetical protein